MLPHDAIVWKKIKAAAIAVAFYLIPSHKVFDIYIYCFRM